MSGFAPHGATYAHGQTPEAAGAGGDQVLNRQSFTQNPEPWNLRP
jgi:hypothetical protein